MHSFVFQILRFRSLYQSITLIIRFPLSLFIPPHLSSLLFHPLPPWLLFILKHACPSPSHSPFHSFLLCALPTCLSGSSLAWSHVFVCPARLCERDELCWQKSRPEESVWLSEMQGCIFSSSYSSPLLTCSCQTHPPLTTLSQAPSRHRCQHQQCTKKFCLFYGELSLT